MNWIIAQLWSKFKAIAYRLYGLLTHLPMRLIRLVRHFGKGLLFLRPRRLYWWESDVNYQILMRIKGWWIGLIMHVLDVFGAAEVYETLMDWVKFNARPLHQWEIELARSVYGDSIDYQRIRIDELSWLGPKQQHFCYVSFYFINSWGPMQDSVFIHELTHIWQYERVGAVYMPQALEAQHSGKGYNYGGVAQLKNCQEKEKSFLSFNFEQQGDIMADYFRIREGSRPQWGNGTMEDLAVYEYFVDQVRNSKVKF